MQQVAMVLPLRDTMEHVVEQQDPRILAKIQVCLCFCMPYSSCENHISLNITARAAKALLPHRTAHPRTRKLALDLSESLTLPVLVQESMKKDATKRDDVFMVTVALHWCGDATVRWRV
jgi:hypothetical protein